MNVLTSPALQSKSLWSYNPIPNRCVFYQPLWSSHTRGLVSKSIDPFGHTCTRTASGILHFTGGTTSNVNFGAIHNNIAKMWVSFWFKLDTAHAAGGGTKYLWGKVVDANHYMWLWLHNGNGKVYLQTDDGGGAQVTSTVATTWAADTWHHVIVSVSDVANTRLVVNGVAATSASTVATPDGGDFIIGDIADPGAGTGFVGEMKEVVCGIDDLSGAEETGLRAGTLPGDETEYWPMDEGSGTTINDQEGTADADGTADSACTWENVPMHQRSNGHYFDGFDDQINCGSGVSIDDLFTGGGTVWGWVNVTSDGLGNVGRIFDKAKVYLNVNSEAASKVKVSFRCDFDGVADGLWTTTATEITLGTKTFVAVTYDDGATTNNPIIYIGTTAKTVGDGLTEDTTPVGANVSDASDSLYIGGDSTKAYSFDGVVGELSFATVIMSAAELAYIYNTTKGRYA